MDIVAIKLTQGKEALVDTDNLEWLEHYSWHAEKSHNIWYAITNIKVWGKYRRFRMHRMILDAPEGMLTDHINRNGLDNRRCNLRICTPSENARNRKHRNTASGYKGVYYKKACKSKPWQVLLTVDGKSKSIGYYETALDGARAYNEAAEMYYGEYAYLNPLNDWAGE